MLKNKKRKTQQSAFNGIDKLHLEFILGALEPSSQDVILDIGCGSGRYARSMKNEFGCQVIGIDLTVPSLKNVFPFIRADAEKLPFKDNIFDDVFAKDVYAHIPNDLIFLKEINRVLKSKGKLCINAPLNPNLSLGYIFSKITGSYPLLPWDKEAGHIHRYNYETVKNMLREAGFVIKRSYFGEFYVNVLIVFCLVPLIAKAKEQKVSSFQSVNQNTSSIYAFLSMVFKTFYAENKVLWKLFYLENKLLCRCPLGSTVMLFAEKWETSFET